MHAAPFDYVRPGALDEAVERLTSAPGGVVLAGGQSLIQSTNLRELRPTILIDVSALPELQGITAFEGGLRIGAATPMARILASADVNGAAPLLATVLRTVGAAAIRTRATLGGSLAWADPCSQVPATLLAMDATVAVTGPRVAVSSVSLSSSPVPTRRRWRRTSSSRTSPCPSARAPASASG